MFHPEYFNQRTQDLKKAYYDGGQFYWASKNLWNNIKNIFDKSKPDIIPSWRVQDVDNLEDWNRLELLYDLLNK